FNNLRKYGQVNYYQKRSGQEIDFILNDMMIALEVKQKGDKNDLIKLQNLSKKLKLNKCYVVSKSFVKGKGYILASNI
ncbi:hypothetical protein HYW75_02605, partial [Candidatus Pacearchaeota archaeon]|nr:hypothetical protein [Candidatus Pacearchaeota archaeon]